MIKSPAQVASSSRLVNAKSTPKLAKTPSNSTSYTEEMPLPSRTPVSNDNSMFSPPPADSHESGIPSALQSVAPPAISAQSEIPLLSQSGRVSQASITPLPSQSVEGPRSHSSGRPLSLQSSEVPLAMSSTSSMPLPLQSEKPPSPTTSRVSDPAH